MYASQNGFLLAALNGVRGSGRPPDDDKWAVLLFFVPTLILSALTILVLVLSAWWISETTTRIVIKVKLEQVEDTYYRNTHRTVYHFLVSSPGYSRPWHMEDSLSDYECHYPQASIGQIRNVWLIHHVYDHRNLPDYYTTSGSLAFCGDPT